MKHDDRSVVTIGAFAALIDAYGGDPKRWPAERRAAMERLLGEDAGARRLQEEASALDRVLAAAPQVPASREPGLADRIVRAASAGTGAMPGEGPSGATARTADVIDLDARRRQKGVAAAPAAFSRGRQVAAALAASLVLGMVIGASDWTRAEIAPLAHAMGFGSDLEFSISQTHEGSEANLDEDLL